MDPQAKALLVASAAADAPSVKDMSIAEAREMFEGLAEFHLPDRSDVVVSDFTAANGNAMIPCRMYRPAVMAGERPPVVVYFHGGGWVIGSIETHDTLCQHLCHHSSAAVVSVDYRLAPEHRHPIAVDDCFTAIRYIVDHQEALMVDAGRLAVAGDSAGGYLATTTAMRAKVAGPEIMFQLLVYPVTNAMFDTPSYIEFSEGYGLGMAEMKYFWASYLGDFDASDASPLQAGDLSGLPPTWILTAEYDVLRDEGEQYAECLRKAGVQVELERWDGQLHGFFHHSGYFDQGKAAVARAGERLKAALQ